MKEEKRTRTKTVTEEYSVFIADDGKEFSSQEKCELYEKIQKDIAKVCPTCAGRGECYHREIVGYTDGLRMHGDAIWGKRWGKCPTCRGKGYLEKEVTWK